MRREIQYEVAARDSVGAHLGGEQWRGQLGGGQLESDGDRQRFEWRDDPQAKGT